MKALLYSLAFLLLLSGCSLLPRQSYPNRNYYTLEAKRQEPGSQSDGSQVLQIQPYEITQEFSGSSFTYQQSDYRFVNDYYNNYVAPPALLITRQSRRWFSQSGIARVPPPHSPSKSTHQLLGAIDELYIDRREPGSPKAKVAITLTLSANGIDSPLLSKQYSAVQIAKCNNAESFAEALSQALGKILVEQEADIKNVLRNTQ